MGQGMKSNISITIGDITTVSSILKFVTIKNLITLNMYVINYLKYAVKLKENSLVVIFSCYLLCIYLFISSVGASL